MTFVAVKRADCKQSAIFLPLRLSVGKAGLSVDFCPVICYITTEIIS